MKLCISASFTSNFFISIYIFSLVKLLFIVIPKFKGKSKLSKLFSPKMIENKPYFSPFISANSFFSILQINSWSTCEQFFKYKW